MAGPLTEDEIQEILRLFPKYVKYFVETGTYKADTTILASKIFEKVFTMEIVELLYKNCVQRVDSLEIKNIDLYHGDSLKRLPEIASSLEESTLFFLDAHQSGGDTSNNGIQVPLYEEITAIVTNRNKKVESDIFVVDDLRLFDAYWDWKGITEEGILNKFKELKCQPYIGFPRNDRYIVYCKYNK